MSRYCARGLKGAGEWKALEKILPDFSGKTVLDLGCGYGWHCKYAADHGAKEILGIDISCRMLETAKQKTAAIKSNTVRRQWKILLFLTAALTLFSVPLPSIMCGISHLWWLISTVGWYLAAPLFFRGTSSVYRLREPGLVLR